MNAVEQAYADARARGEAKERERLALAMRIAGMAHVFARGIVDGAALHKKDRGFQYIVDVASARAILAACERLDFVIDTELRGEAVTKEPAP